jgi:CheY-like chemotaxis protein
VPDNARTQFTQPPTPGAPPPPLILLANADKWFLDSLESVLVQGGFRVVTATRRPVVLARARELRPDAILLDLSLGISLRASAPADGFALCRALRADPGITPATPIILTTAGPALRALQLEALRAGAWELRGEPLDTEELLLRLSAYVRGKLLIDQLGGEGLIDRTSGLYNEAGVARRSAELAAFTARQGLPISCAVFRPTESLTPAGTGDRLALAFKYAGRVSDAIGRTGPTEFTIFAPATDQAAAEKLVRRITDMVARTAAVKLRAGIAAAPGRPPQPPAELLARAREALR